MFSHAVYRAIILVVLGVFLASNGSKQTSFIFTNVLAQIGLGYLFVFLLLNRPVALQVLAAVAILAADWAMFARHPVPPRQFAWSDVGVYANWEHLRGFDAHWEKNANIAATFDRWFLNLFPRPEDKPFQFNAGGYATLNFVPSIVTMLMGVLAGQWLGTKRSPTDKVRHLLLAGALGIVLGSALDTYHICPSVKRLWTPSWTVYSGGWALLQLAMFYWVIDARGYRRWTFPLLVVGANSIAMYMMSQLMKPWILGTLKTHLGGQAFGGFYAPLKESLGILFVEWLVCYWMHRRKIFLKI
jgi:heparan-alpha-glucosaminide N-acetyltransferase